MLVISRHAGSRDSNSLLIDGRIAVVVAAVKGKTVTLRVETVSREDDGEWAATAAEGNAADLCTAPIAKGDPKKLPATFQCKVNQGIVFGTLFAIRVTKVGLDAASLGVFAAPDIPVHRREVWECIRREVKKQE